MFPSPRLRGESLLTNCNPTYNGRISAHNRVMRVCVLTLVSFYGLAAADPQQLAVALKAQSDFDKVELTPIPQLKDTGVYVQSQAAILSVSPPEELALVHFRKGFCTLAGAAVTHNNREF